MLALIVGAAEPLTTAMPFPPPAFKVSVFAPPIVSAFDGLMKFNVLIAKSCPSTLTVLVLADGVVVVKTTSVTGSGIEVTFLDPGPAMLEFQLVTPVFQALFAPFQNAPVFAASY